MPKATTTTTTATAATTMTTRLSTCGGFVTRRISQMQARNEHRSSIATASPMSFGNCLRHEPVSVAATIEAPTTAATTTATVACQRLCGLQPCSLMSSGNYWVLGALLIILTASCLPSAIASPRRMVGRHLILPHRHHVHLRSAGQEHHPPPNRFMNCMVGMNVTEASTAHAIIVSEETRNATIDLLESWLQLKDFNSMEEAKRQYRLHDLDLEYPLKEAANNSDYDGEDSESPEVELEKIFESLSKLRQLMSHINKFLPNDWYKDYFNSFEDKLEHNMSVAANMLGIQNCPMEPTNEVPAHRHNHPLLEFAIVEEMTRLLNVLEKKYRVMHRRVMEAANA